MSADYLSWVAWLRPSVARALVEDDPDEEEAPIRAPDGSVVFHPGIDREFRPKALARAVGSEWPVPKGLRVSIAGTQLFRRASARGVDDEGHGVFVNSRTFPLLPLVDRLLAIPRGVRFMEGRGFARFRPNRRARLASAWPELLEGLGGEEAAARRVAPYVDRESDGEEQVRRVLAAVTKGLRLAERKGCDLVLVGADAAW